MKTISEIQYIFLVRHEYGKDVKKDQFGRYIPDQKSEWLSDPIVSDYLSQNGFSPIYPGSHKFAVCVSHDVDRLFEKKWGIKTLLNQQARAVLKGDFGSIKENFKNAKRRIFPGNDLKIMLEIEERFEMKSTYFFLSLEKEEEDFNYAPNEIKEIFELLKSNGHEIALHGGHLAYDNFEKIAQEKFKLENTVKSKIIGYRNHYLRFDIEKTWIELGKNNFLYDSTFGFAQNIGFRNGMAHPFLAHDNTGKSLGIFVLPLMIMDVTLKNYLKIYGKDAFEACRKIMDKVIHVNGTLTLLWHNNNTSKEQMDLYLSILEYLKQKDAWFTTSQKLIEHYRENKYFEEMNSLLKL